MSDSEQDAPQQAFPLPSKLSPSSTDGPPATAEQYLLLVRQQAAALPKVLTSHAPPPPTRRNRPGLSPTRLPPAPPFALPPPQWARHLVVWFSHLQESLSAKRPNENLLIRVHTSDVLTKAPTLSYVLHMHRVLIVSSLRAIDDQLHPPHLVHQSALAEQFMMPHCPVWLFSLLAMLEIPVSADIAAILRSLLHKASIARCALKGAEDDRLPPLNVLITLLANHFGQGDVA